MKVIVMISGIAFVCGFGFTAFALSGKVEHKSEGIHAEKVIVEKGEIQVLDSPEITLPVTTIVSAIHHSPKKAAKKVDVVEKVWVCGEKTELLTGGFVRNCK